ncbi:MAG: hypothetical protein AAFX87_29080 [Bacteroidota bacterium]
MENKKNIKALPFFYVGKKLTEERIDRFLKRRHPALCEELGREDTRSIWYTRDHIAQLLEEIDKAGGNGIRMSFGVYEEGHRFAGQTCIVSNVTREVSKNGMDYNVNVVVENEPDFSERHALWEEKQVFEDFNFGSPCPPRCDEPEETLP